MNRDVPRGDIPTLILAVLMETPRHGYAIAREIERLSETALRLREGSLYPALRILEQDGHITGHWEIPGSGPARKVYTITESGSRELSRRIQEWEQYARTMRTILKGASPDEQPVEPVY
ncbi:MAG: PadR family transcriptional regulator [Armatimonadaceae bacterium]